MEKLTKIFFIAVAVMYAIWPFDLMPGVPLDDIIVAVASIALSNSFPTLISRR